MPFDRATLDLLMEELGRGQLLDLLQDCLLWVLGGAALGLILGLACYKIFRRLRWYGATSTAGRWTQRLLAALSIVVCMLALGLAGLGEGLHQQARSVITTSQLGAKTLARLGNEIADGLVWLDLALQQRGAGKPAELNAALADFRAGKRELPAQEFLQRLDQANRETLEDILGALETKLLQANPRLPAWATRMMRQGIQDLGTTLLEKKLSAEMKAHGLAPIYTAIRESLVAESARTGNPRTIGRVELSTLLLRQGIIPAIVTPVHAFIRQQQVWCLLATVLACFLPALLCRLFRPAASSPQAAGT